MSGVYKETRNANDEEDIISGLKVWKTVKRDALGYVNVSHCV